MPAASWWVHPEPVRKLMSDTAMQGDALWKTP